MFDKLFRKPKRVDVNEELLKKNENLRVRIRELANERDGIYLEDKLYINILENRLDEKTLNQCKQEFELLKRLIEIKGEIHHDTSE